MMNSSSSCSSFFVSTFAARLSFLLSIAIGVLVLSVPLFSQGNNGRILGTVTDQTGGVVAGATVTIIDKDRGVARTLTTDDAGEYNAPNLLPGTYMVRADANGFRRLEHENVELGVGKEIRVDVTLQPGAPVQTITVTESIPLVETTNATLGGTIANTDINDLPLNGRNYQSLLGLRPGVTIQKGGSPFTQSTNNTRPDETSWTLEGILNSDPYEASQIAGAGSFFTDGALILPVDAIQEFNLMENPKAEYGGKPGAIVNVGIRSGTNELHGAAYAFGRDGAWDARNVFNPAPGVIQPVQLEQFGGVVGGPIKKDKLFFFAGYEGLRSSLGNTIPGSVPETASQATAGNPAGDTTNSMVDAIRALQAAGVTVSPVSKALFGCPAGPLNAASTCTGGLIQEPSAGANNNTTSFLSTVPNTNVSDNGIAKIDYHINDKNMISGMFWRGMYSGIGIGGETVNPAWESSNPLLGQSIAGDWVYTPTSRLVNEFRAGYNRFGIVISPLDTNLFANGKDYPLNTGITSFGGFPGVKIAGFGRTLLGNGSGPSGNTPNPYYEFQDNVSYLLSKHALKFGVDISHSEADNFNHDVRGSINFQGGANSNAAFLCPPPNPTAASCSTSLEDFFAGLPSFGSQLIGSPNDTVTWHSVAGFFQDDWRITPKIILNLGLRYAYYTPLHEIHNLVGGFDPTLGMVQQGQASVGSALWKPDRKNWSPRLGFAWDLTGKGTTVIRGEAGIFYSLYAFNWFTGGAPNSSSSIDAVPTGACTTPVSIGTPCPKTFGGTLVNATPQIPAANLNWDPAIGGSLNGGVVFPTGATISCTAAAPCSISTVDPHLKTPTIASWNLGVQHAFGGNISLDITYVGNHGHNLLGTIDENQLNPTTGLRPFSQSFPYLQFINEIFNDAKSNYNSVQTTLTQRLSHGLDYTIGYTYGHGLDNGSLNRFGTPPMNSFNPQAEYASSDYDIRHRATFTAGYEIPGKKGFGQLLEGWKLNAIVNIAGAQPWSPIDTSNNFAWAAFPQGNGEGIGRWDFFGNPSDFQVTSSSLPFCTGFAPDFLTTGGKDLAGVSCSTTSGVSTIVSPLPSSMASACSVAPDITTLSAPTGGCYVSTNGKSVMVPPVAGTFGTMGRNIFRDTGFKNVDFSIFKSFKFKERYNAEFRVEFFNLFNHPILANPYSFSSGNDPSVSSTFGCGCATPDFASGNPIVGSGSPRDIQLGLKLAF